MDFVLRDAYMSGYNTAGLRSVAAGALHVLHRCRADDPFARGLPTLINFIETRANLFRTIYFHRTVRALDLSLEDVFPETMRRLFPGNPLEHLDAYRRFTESSFLVDVGRWETSSEPELRDLGQRWAAILSRNVVLENGAASGRSISTAARPSERRSIPSRSLVEQRVRSRLPASPAAIPLRVDVARHYHRPSGRRPAGGQNFLLNPATEACRN